MLVYWDGWMRSDEGTGHLVSTKKEDKIKKRVNDAHGGARHGNIPRQALGVKKGCVLYNSAVKGTKPKFLPNTVFIASNPRLIGILPVAQKVAPATNSKRSIRESEDTSCSL